MSGHAAPLTVPEQQRHGHHCYGHKYHGLSRVHTGTRVLCLLDEARHVFQEEVVHVLLVHLPQFTVLPHVHLGAEDSDNHNLKSFLKPVQLVAEPLAYLEYYEVCLLE